MANITYKLFDPATKQYVLMDGKETKTTTASKQQIEDFARKKGYKVNYIETAADYAMPKFDMGDIGMTTAADVAETPPITQQNGVIMTPTEKAATDVSRLEAAAGGFLTGLTLDFRDQIFGKDEAGVIPAEAEEAAYPKTFKTMKAVGEIVPNIGVDLGLLAASRGRIQSPAALAAGGAAITNLLQSIGQRDEPLAPITQEEALQMAGSTIGSALGGAAGQKILGPLLAAGGKYVSSKLPKLGIKGFPDRPSPEILEERMSKLAKSAEEEMVKKQALAAIEPDVKQKQSILGLRTKSLSSAQKKMLEEAKGAKEFLEQFKPTPAEMKEFERIKAISKEAERLKSHFVLPGKEPPKVPTKAEIAEFDRIKSKLQSYKKAEANLAKDEEGRALELFGEYEGGIIPETVIKPKLSRSQINEVLKKAADELTPDELFVAIEKHEIKRLANQRDLEKLANAISELDTGINVKRQMFDALEKRLNNLTGTTKERAIQYLTDMRFKTLGGLIGRQAGAAGAEYGMEKPGTQTGQRDYTAEALNSLLMPK